MLFAEAKLFRKLNVILMKKEFILWATTHSRSLLTVVKRLMGLWEPGSESSICLCLRSVQGYKAPTSLKICWT